MPLTSLEVIFVVLGDTDCVWFAWVAWWECSAAPGDRGQSYPQLQMTSRRTHGRSESIWDTGGTSVKTHLRKGNKLPNSQERENRQLRLTHGCTTCLNMLGENVVLPHTVQHRVPAGTQQHIAKECMTRVRDM